MAFPRLREISGREAVAKLTAFLQSIDVDCTLDASGRYLTYGPESEGAELEFIRGMIGNFEARIEASLTPEERKEEEELKKAMKSES